MVVKPFNTFEYFYVSVILHFTILIIIPIFFQLTISVSVSWLIKKYIEVENIDW